MPRVSTFGRVIPVWLSDHFCHLLLSSLWQPSHLQLCFLYRCHLKYRLCLHYKICICVRLWNWHRCITVYGLHQSDLWQWRSRTLDGNNGLGCQYSISHQHGPLLEYWLKMTNFEYSTLVSLPIGRVLLEHHGPQVMMLFLIGVLTYLLITCTPVPLRDPHV
jgi:hypothetical protein